MFSNHGSKDCNAETCSLLPAVAVELDVALEAGSVDDEDGGGGPWRSASNSTRRAARVESRFIRVAIESYTSSLTIIWLQT